MDIQKQWYKTLLAVVLASALNCYSEVIIITPDTPYALKIAEDIRGKIIKTSKIQNSITEIKKDDVILAIGHDALIQAGSQTDAKILGSFINYADVKELEQRKNITKIIYSDPSPESVARFIDVNFRNKKIGYVYSNSDIDYVNKIKSSLLPKNNQIIDIGHSGNIFSELNKLSRSGIDIMLIGNNRGIYKPDNIQLVLESLFRKRTPVIATSKQLIGVGASITLTPKETKLIDLTTKLVNDLNTVEKNRKGSLVEKIFIDELEVTIKPSMIEIYNLRIKEPVR